MRKSMYDIKSVVNMIARGQQLMLSGDEKVLRQLPKGRWIGGTIPYFLSENGGLFSQELISVTQMPDYVQSVDIKVYDEKGLANVYVDAPENGFSLIIIPATSKTHLSFALNAPNYRNFAVRPLIGWISGVFLDELGKVSPKVYNGVTGQVLEDAAVVMHVTLPKDRSASLNIVNIFEQGKGETFEFPEAGFSAGDILINGQKQNLAEFVAKSKLDISYPLIADYYGVKTNVSFQAVDQTNKKVNFYAPVFKGLKYKHAEPIDDYVKVFLSQMPVEKDTDIVFSCNCILNYLYSKLEGKKTGEYVGPVTFGEIAYQLLNQTMVYLKINKI